MSLPEDLKAELEKALELPCWCDEAYKSRQLTQPDCPRCNFQDDLRDAVTPILERLVADEEKARDAYYEKDAELAGCEAKLAAAEAELKRREAYQIEITTALTNEKAAAEAELDRARYERDAAGYVGFDIPGVIKALSEDLDSARALLARRPHLCDVDGPSVVYLPSHYHRESECARLGGTCAK